MKGFIKYKVFTRNKKVKKLHGQAYLKAPLSDSSLSKDSWGTKKSPVLAGDALIKYHNH